MYDAYNEFAALFPGEEDYFVSGSNHPGEIRGLANTGSHIGVAAPEVREAAIAELGMLAGTGTKVFVDSGAFGEVEFTRSGPRVKKLITPPEWERRLALYERLAKDLGEQLYCVAPDMVGFQKETLERLERYAPALRRLMGLGANLVVPVQKGELPMQAFAERATAILGTDDVVWGIPSKKDATSLADLEDFAAYLLGKAKPTRLHLLGLGPSSKRFMAAYRAVVLNSPWTRVFSDSVRITALVGRGKNPRPLTRATDAVVAEAACVLTTAEKKARAMTKVFAGFVREKIAEARACGWYDPETEEAPMLPLGQLALFLGGANGGHGRSATASHQ